MAVKKFKAGTSTWATAEHWEESGVPVIGDDVEFLSTSGSCEGKATAAKARGINAEKYTGELSFTTGSLEIGTTSESLGGVALKFNTAGLMTFKAPGIVKFKSSAGVSEKIFTGGNAFKEFVIATLAANCKYKLEDELKVTTLAEIARGELNTNGKLCEWAKFNSNSTSARSLILGSSTVKLTGTGLIWFWKG